MLGCMATQSWVEGRLETEGGGHRHKGNRWKLFGVEMKVLKVWEAIEEKILKCMEPRVGWGKWSFFNFG